MGTKAAAPDGALRYVVWVYLQYVVQRQSDALKSGAETLDALCAACGCGNASVPPAPRQRRRSR